MEETNHNTETPFPPKKKKLLETNRILSLTAIFVSVCTLFILLYQTHLSNKMYFLEEKAQKMSVFPHLKLMPSFPDEESYWLGLTNNGVGPAKIKAVYVRYQDSTYTIEPVWFIINILNPGLDDKIEGLHYSSLLSGHLVPMGSEIKLVGSSDVKSIAQLVELFEGKADVAVTYTSIYEDEIWTSYLGNHFPVPLESDTAQ